MRHIARSPLLLVFLSWLTLILGCSAGSNTNQSSNITSKPVEYQLAFLDSLKDTNYLRDDDVRINRVRYLLDMVAQKTGDSKQHIADRTVQATKLIHDNYGRDIKNIEFLEQTRDFLDAAPKDSKFSYDQVSTMLTITYAH